MQKKIRWYVFVMFCIGACRAPVRTAPTDGAVDSGMLPDFTAPLDLVLPVDQGPADDLPKDSPDLTPVPTCAFVTLTDNNHTKQWQQWVPGTFDGMWNPASPVTADPNVPDQVPGELQLTAVVDVVKAKGPGCADVEIESIDISIETDFYIGPPCETYMDRFNGKGLVRSADCGVFYSDWPRSKQGVLSVGHFPDSSDHIQYRFLISTSFARHGDTLRLTPRSLFYIMTPKQNETYTRVVVGPAHLLVYQ